MTIIELTLNVYKDFSCITAEVIPCCTNVCTIIMFACIKYLKLFTICKNLATASLSPGDRSLRHTICAAYH